MRSLAFFLSSVFLFTPASYGRHLLSFGVKAGVPLTDAFSDTTSTSVDVITHTFSSSKNYAAGMMLELSLPLGFSVEADALYRPLNMTVNTQVLPSLTSHLSNDVSSVEFPILAKYHFLHLPVLRPYVEAGPVFRAVGASGSYLSDDGFALGGGVDIKLLLVRISPEIRYSRWGKDGTAATGLTAPSSVNQAEFLVGVSF